MRRSQRLVAIAGGATSAAVLALAGLAPALATAGPGWRPLESRHSGPPSYNTGYVAIVAPARHDAWALGGTNWVLHGNYFRSGRPLAEHWDGRAWHAGLWLGLAGNNRVLPAHRARGGRWQIFPFRRGAGFLGLALIPGTTSPFAAGAAPAGQGGNAVVWGYGPASRR